MDLLPGCAQGQGRGQRSRDIDTFVMSRKSLLLTIKWLDCDETLTHTTVPRWSASKVCSRSRSKVTWYNRHNAAICLWEEAIFVKFYMCWYHTTWPLILKVSSTACILTKLSLSLTFPSLCPFGFLLQIASQFANGCELAIAHVVKQFVRLIAIQYGLTFCLYVRSLYKAPLHSPSILSIRQLDLISKSWNELFRHCRMISVF